MEANDTGKVYEDENGDVNRQWEDYEKINDIDVKLKTKNKRLYQNRIVEVEKLDELISGKCNKGLCGSQNLGNTCFMNSAIQCVSHSLDLTYYFLSQEYEKEINPNNKLGLKGKLANAWYKVLHDLWLGSSRYTSLSSFKSTIAKIAPQFTGYGQQDSHELMTFLLDGIHEDLNKVSVKPYKEVAEKGEDEDDETAAKRFWDLHLLRNDSIIVDLFHGQYRSTITCPECHRVSITYDPFTTVPLPIPKLKKVDVYYVPQFNIKKTIKLSIFISQDALFFDVAHYIQQDLSDKIGRFRCMIITKNECVKMVKASDNIITSALQGYIFCFEVDPQMLKSDYFNMVVNIRDPVKNENKSYPRIFTVSNKMTLRDFIEKIYGFMRRFMDLPEPINKALEFKYEKLLERFAERVEGSYEDYESIIKEEYEFFFNSKHEEEMQKEVDSFVDNLPFEIYITNGSDKKILFSQNINKLLENVSITDNTDDSMTEIIELIKSGYKVNLDLINLEKLNQEKLKSMSSCYNLTSKEKEKKLNLFDCMEHFRLTEKLEKNNEWYCKDCKKHQRAYKKLELFYTPKLLVLHLKRFEYSSMGKYRTYAEKIGGEIDFPLDKLNLSSHIIGPDSSNAIYELYAVSQHYGSCGGGHYTAICRNGAKWYNFNDSSVSPSSESSVVDSAAYLLFYRRKEDTL